MKRASIVCSLLLSVMLGTQAHAAAPPQGGVLTNVALHHAVGKSSAKPRARRSDGVITYNRDSPNPNIGWHWQDGMRVCTQDCDNPEIPGSGFTCRNVRLFGMNWRECDN
jgi:hypothetical protein